MASRFTFSTRDWMWLCVVIAMAIGWSGTFRYAEWVEHNYVGSAEQKPVPFPELTKQLDEATGKASVLSIENRALEYGINAALTTEQKAKVHERKSEYFDKRMWLLPEY